MLEWMVVQMSEDANAQETNEWMNKRTYNQMKEQERINKYMTHSMQEMKRLHAIL